MKKRSMQERMQELVNAFKVVRDLGSLEQAAAIKRMLNEKQISFSTYCSLRQVSK